MMQFNFRQISFLVLGQKERVGAALCVARLQIESLILQKLATTLLQHQVMMAQ